MTRIYNSKTLGWVRYALPILWLLGSGSCALTAYGDVTNAELLAWVQQTRLPTAVQQALSARIVVAPQAYQWLVVQDQQIYALAYKPLATTTHTQVKQANRSLVERRVRNLLFLYAVGEHYQQRGFGNREAIAKALTTLETTTTGRLLSGLQSRAAVLNNGVVALVWIDEDRIVSYRRQPPAVKEFSPAYCQALYPTAQALFLEHKHREALVVYQEMQGLQCRKPMVYFIDAAECFLAIKQFDDAKRLGDYILREQASVLSSTDLERLGDVLLQIGDVTAASKAYELALSRLTH